MVIFKLNFSTSNNTSVALFTFQYGDIQIKINQNKIKLKKYYLHSNMVIFKLPIYDHIIIGKNDLHSNMVIFKCIILSLSIIMSFSFTFQYGDIQIGEDEKSFE